MGVLLLYIVGTAVIVIGIILLFISKSESQTSIKIKNWIGVQTNSTGFIMVFVGILSIALGMIKEEGRIKTVVVASVRETKLDSAVQTESNTSKVVQSDNEAAKHTRITQTYAIKSVSKTVLIRYMFYDIDTMYRVPVDMSFFSLKMSLLKHFYGNEKILERGEASIFLNRKLIRNERLSLKAMKVKDGDIIHLEIKLPEMDTG